MVNKNFKPCARSCWNPFLFCWSCSFLQIRNETQLAGFRNSLPEQTKQNNCTQLPSLGADITDIMDCDKLHTRTDNVAIWSSIVGTIKQVTDKLSQEVNTYWSIILRIWNLANGYACRLQLRCHAEVSCIQLMGNMKKTRYKHAISHTECPLQMYLSCLYIFLAKHCSWSFALPWFIDSLPPIFPANQVNIRIELNCESLICSQSTSTQAFLKDR